MRTTLTLDDDVAAALERRRREHRRSLKQEVNELLRIGLVHAEREQPAPTGLEVEPWDGGECLVGSLDDVAAALSAVEDEARR